MKNLQPFQRVWLLANINEEYEQQAKAMKGSKKGSQTFDIDSAGIDPATFEGLKRLASLNGNNPG